MHLKLLVGQPPKIVHLPHRGQLRLGKVCQIMIMPQILALDNQDQVQLKAQLQSIWNHFNLSEKLSFLKMVGEEIMLSRTMLGILTEKAALQL